MSDRQSFREVWRELASRGQVDEIDGRNTVACSPPGSSTAAPAISGPLSPATVWTVPSRPAREIEPKRRAHPMWPARTPGPPPVAVPILRLECLLICPGCQNGVGFLHPNRIEPGQGIQVTCPKCAQRIGVRVDTVDLGRPTILRG